MLEDEFITKLVFLGWQLYKDGPITYLNSDNKYNKQIIINKPKHILIINKEMPSFETKSFDIAFNYILIREQKE